MKTLNLYIIKNTTLIIMCYFLTLTGCNAQPEEKLSVKELNESSLPDFYLQHSTFTDPGDFAYLYDQLPDSLPELCQVIRDQFIHPHAELPQYRDQIPKERWRESFRYPTVQSVLEGLVTYDARGFVNDRKPEDRLILGCRHNAIILASILKYRGIPARVRCGHVNYLIPDFHTSHTICEVWNKNENRWMLVDPSTNMIDFSREKFDFSNEAWLELQRQEIDPSQYGVPGRYSGLISILGKVNTDLASVLGTEYPIYQYAPILDYARENKDQLTSNQIETLNEICELMNSLDADNLSKLQDIYKNTPEIQITRQFKMKGGKPEKETSK